jgi:uncharacterized protein YigE (DUF2233 family)
MTSRAITICVTTLLWVAAPTTATADPCRSESFKGTSYIVCSFDPRKDNLRLFWLRDGSKPYRTFAALAADLEARGESLQFAINGGIYQDDFRPVGLYIENGRELVPANTASRSGSPSQIPNFYKKPNGVFYVGNKKAGVLETMFTRCRRLRPKRSSFQTTSVSPSLRACEQAARPGRSSFFPDAVSLYRCRSLTPAASSASICRSST